MFKEKFAEIPSINCPERKTSWSAKQCCGTRPAYHGSGVGSSDGAGGWESAAVGVDLS